MELYNIYCGFWEGMKEISVGGVPKWIYMVGNLWKIKVDSSRKDQVKKKKKEKGLEQKKKNRSAIWTLLCKVSGIGIIWKEKLCSTSL